MECWKPLSKGLKYEYCKGAGETTSSEDRRNAAVTKRCSGFSIWLALHLMAYEETNFPVWFPQTALHSRQKRNSKKDIELVDQHLEVVSVVLNNTTGT
jgi:hypothetical protein